MMRRFLCETTLEGYRALSVGRHLVYDSWDQVHAFLQGTLGEAHAAVFAEPHGGSGVIAWMTTTQSDPQPVASLPEAEQAAALARLRGLLSDIAAAAEAKAASPNMEDQRWAALLQAIQTVPASRNLAEILYVANGQPVLVQWGTRDENVTAHSATLQEKIARGVEPPPLPPVGRDPSPGARPALGAGPVTGAMTAGAVEGRPWGWLPALLLWLLFLALLAAIYWRLLLACILAPPFGPELGTCAVPAEARAADPAADQARLLRDLELLRQQLAQAPQCRIETALLPPEEVPPAPVPAPLPEPEPRAEVEPDPQTDLDRAREQAGGQTGDVTVTLLWNGFSDLDLTVVCPDGSRLVAWEPPRCGGEIDVDANRCTARSGGGDARACDAYGGTEPLANPVENAFFVNDGAQRGAYKVQVRHYAGARGDPGAQVPFALQVRQGGESRVQRGSLANGETVTVTEFTIE